MKPRCAVIGAGYAGLAAAVELTAAGIPVDIFESSRTLGGRARHVNFDGMAVDNGQHIFIGAYRETLRLMRRVGANPELLLQRLPLTLDYPGELRIAAPRLPAPLHLAVALLGASGLNLSEKLTAIRFMQAIKRNHFRLLEDISVTALMDIHRQPPKLRRYLWEPLCISALNTPAAAASAQVFLNVLRDSLAAERQASDLLLPRVDLSQLLPQPAADFITTHGGQLHRATAIKAITHTAAGYTLHGKVAYGPYAHVVVAAAPYHLPPLLTQLPELTAVVRKVESFAWEPILTCYLAYPPQVRLPMPMQGYVGGMLQWLFDRGQLGGPPGLLAAVISAHGQHEELSREEIARRLHQEITARHPGLPPPLKTLAITEQRATFACTPGLARPGTVTALPGLLLAGDYVASDYPATLESAVRSGIQAAAAVRGTYRHRPVT
ncbi:MAG: FAD-dependent oxidoreductase [Betaproteobacteria bacterium]|nr:FAD-dependent oxidoreductase [Betaproteobacteria bacterium]